MSILNVGTVRTPLLPYNIFTDYLRKCDEMDVYQYICQDEELKHYISLSLLLSNQSLYVSFIDPPKNKRKYEKFVDTLLEYLDRAAIRCTPFSTFACVSLSEIKTPSDNCEVSANISNDFMFDLRVSYEWYNQVIKQLEYKYMKSFRYIFNDACYVSGNRLINPCFAAHGTRKNKEVGEVSIRYTALMDLIMDCSSSHFIGYCDIYNVIKKVYPDASSCMVDQTLSQLIDNEFLFSEIRVRAFDNHKVNRLVEILDQRIYECEELSYLRTICEQIEAIRIGKHLHVEQIKMLLREMEHICMCDDYLICNVGRTLEYVNVSTKVMQKIDRYINLLVNMPIIVDNLVAFRDRFIQEYGTNIEVPVETVIDTNGFNGLEYFNTREVVNENLYNYVTQVVNSKISAAICAGRDKVTLDENDFPLLEKDIVNPIACEKSFDLNFVISGNKYNPEISQAHNIGSNIGGGMIQRFRECVDFTEFSKYNLNLGSSFGTNYEIVELSEMYPNGRIHNVENTQSNMNYCIPLGWISNQKMKRAIKLSEINLGMTSNCHFYLVDRVTRKRIKIISANMLNLDIRSRLARLLHYTSENYSYNITSSLYYILKSKRKYTPDIYICDISVMRARWEFNKYDLSKDNFECFSRDFRSLKKDYNIDRMVYLVFGDNKLMLDTDNERFLRIAYKHFRRMGKIQLERIECNCFSSNIVTNQYNEAYQSEFVFTYMGEKKIIRDQRDERAYDKQLIDEGRVLFPGENGWHYYKLYCHETRANEVITFIDENLNNAFYYYVRYCDEKGFHIRLRVRFSSADYMRDQSERLQTIFNEMRRNKMIMNLSEDCYIREVNRYGGYKLLEKCETYFYNDSRFIAEALRVGEDLETLYLRGILSIYWWIYDDMEKELNHLKNYSKDDKKIRAEYKKKDRIYLKMIKHICEDDMSVYSGKIKCYLVDLKKSILDIVHEYKKIFKSQPMTTELDELATSLTHMHCNRLEGNVENERYYTTLASYIAEHWVGYKKYNGR